MHQTAGREVALSGWCMYRTFAEQIGAPPPVPDGC